MPALRDAQAGTGQQRGGSLRGEQVRGSGANHEFNARTSSSATTRSTAAPTPLFGGVLRPGPPPSGFRLGGGLAAGPVGADGKRPLLSASWAAVAAARRNTNSTTVAGNTANGKPPTSSAAQVPNDATTGGQRTPNIDHEGYQLVQSKSAQKAAQQGATGNAQQQSSSGSKADAVADVHMADETSTGTGTGQAAASSGGHPTLPAEGQAASVRAPGNTTETEPGENQQDQHPSQQPVDEGPTQSQLKKNGNVGKDL